MANDLNYSNINSWIAWVGVNEIGIGEDGKDYTDGLLAATKDFSEYKIVVRYYAVAHFSKIIPKGSIKISTEKNINDVIKTVEEKDGAENITLMKYGVNCVSYLTPDNKIVTVAVNKGVERKIDFNADANCMSIYITTQENKMFAYKNLEVQEFSIPAESITTIVFENKERCLIKSVSLFLYGDIANYRLQLYFALLQSYIISCQNIFANNF